MIVPKPRALDSVHRPGACCLHRAASALDARRPGRATRPSLPEALSHAHLTPTAHPPPPNSPQNTEGFFPGANKQGGRDGVTILYLDGLPQTPGGEQPSLPHPQLLTFLPTPHPQGLFLPLLQAAHPTHHPGSTGGGLSHS